LDQRNQNGRKDRTTAVAALALIRSAMNRAQERRARNRQRAEDGAGVAGWLLQNFGQKMFDPDFEVRTGNCQTRGGFQCFGTKRV
jgi:hypothetical protein